MKVETIKCDVCGALKREANKWLVIQVQETADEFNEPYITISSKINSCVTEDICSDACLQKRLGQVLGLIRDGAHAPETHKCNLPIIFNGIDLDLGKPHTCSTCGREWVFFNQVWMPKDYLKTASSSDEHL